MLSLNEIFSSAICRMLLVGAVLSALPGDEREVPSLSSPGRALMSLLQPAGRLAVASDLEVEERGRRTNLDNLPDGTTGGPTLLNLHWALKKKKGALTKFRKKGARLVVT